MFKKWNLENRKGIQRVVILLLTLIMAFFLFDISVESTEKRGLVVGEIAVMQSNALSKVLDYVQSMIDTLQAAEQEQMDSNIVQEVEQEQSSDDIVQVTNQEQKDQVATPITITLTEEDYEMHVEYAMIWPIQNTEYFDMQGNAIGIINAGTMLTIAEEVGDYFKVYYDNQYVYVPSNICMINLPDVMHEACQYNITNSYSSIYKIHGKKIPEVTGEVLYPYVQDEEGDFLVPLLYPVAKQLFEAELDALSKGYTIKIYDAYRPHEVTQYIYGKMSDFLAKNESYERFVNGTVKGVTYTQSNFLAQSVSNHNYGVAVDMTLVNLATGEELDVQSSMHELSIASVLSLNTEDADILQDLMLSHGFKGLASEWWHFEIKDYRTTYAAFQVSREGYHVTEDGIYYETKDGQITWLEDADIGMGWSSLN